MEENETVTDVTETPESESDFPIAFVFGLGAGVLSTLAAWKLTKRFWKKPSDDVVVGEVVDSPPPAPPATS